MKTTKVVGGKAWRWVALGIVGASALWIAAGGDNPSASALRTVRADNGASQETFLTENVWLRVPAATRLTRRKIQLAAEQSKAARLAGAAPSQEIPFRPTIDESSLRAFKESAARAGAAAPSLFGLANRARRSRANLLGPKSLATATPTPLFAPSFVDANFEGVGNAEACDGCRPPDTHGAVGNTQFVEITNFNINVFAKAAPNTELLSVRLADFFNFKLETLFDPRVLYDPIWDRWVIYAEAFKEAPGLQRVFLAISTTPDATGPYFKYSFNIDVYAPDDFWDFGQLGMDQDAVILTGNIFGDAGGYRTTRMFAIAKARLYNGLGFFVPLWTGLVGTCAPPNVLDQNAFSFLVSAPPSGATVFKYTLHDSANAFQQTVSVVGIPVPFYAPPANASQPGTGAQLDTLDARFQNNSTQVGDRLFQVHTVAIGPFPTPLWYEFNTTTNTIVQAGFFFSSLTSHDWNPSIVANGNRDAFVTWSSTEPGASRGAPGIPPQVRFSGRLAADPLGVISAGAALFTSPASYELFRWGDYSAITIDPFNAQKAWLVNETVASPFVWGTRIGAVRY